MANKGFTARFPLIKIKKQTVFKKEIYKPIPKTKHKWAGFGPGSLAREAGRGEKGISRRES
jgi:hypothetical protein